MNSILYNEEYFKSCDKEGIVYLYNNQYDEEQNIPYIDMIKDEGDIIYKIYCYGNSTKYLCKVFDDPDSDFMSFMH